MPAGSFVSTVFLPRAAPPRRPRLGLASMTASAFSSVASTVASGNSAASVARMGAGAAGSPGLSDSGFPERD